MRKLIIKYLLFLTMLTATTTFGQNFSHEVSPEGILLKDGSKKVLFFQSQEKSLNGNYPRANYIHPLFDLDGNVLTEDFPDDHLHHRGIFWAWHQVLMGKKEIGDSWECKNFKWDVKNVQTKDYANDAILLKAHTQWTSPLYTLEGEEVPFVDENTEIKVLPATASYRIIDFKISLLALVDSLKIGGSKDVKGYGGFSARVKLPEDVGFYSNNVNIVPTNQAVTANRHINIQGSFNNKEKSGIIIIAGKENPEPNNKWILRSENSMQNAAFPGRKAIKISTRKPLILKYRLIIYKENPNQVTLNKLLDF
ncbi:DUF6807 family protein [Galbibacter pacificus]|uniref:PmoA family protein n=1 Tax=Galbibacter pacificus TaxID=2996052 RepID=A0ABT6FMG1_9FLAO|nr:DUF6807 family protein [Galbibacter pacificus]MDG3580968.1 PmoA family protein [Galbibacter pacificus]MDG3584446.1 PmoA family protein [Galbibacter pacificus]